MDKTDSYNVAAEADQAHDDQWLADAVMTILGEDIWYFAEWLGLEAWTENHGEDALKEIIVLSWQVAGALMEAVRTSGEPPAFGAYKWLDLMRDIRRTPLNESLPHSIITACVKALS